jgi:hypothetical protein
VSRRVIVVFAAFALLMVATSRVQVAGDAHEYITMAVSIVTLGSPSPTPAELARLEPRLAEYDVPVLRDALHEGRDGRLHHRHFWLYPLLAAPGVAATTALGLHPVWAFALVNVVLLSLAAGILAPRAGILPVALLCAGPIIWWIDKAHPEVYVFAMLVIGLATLSERPGAALIAFGMATAQYPPLGLLLVLGFAAVLWREPRRRTDGRFLAGAAAGAAIAALQPAHSLWKLGVLSPLMLWGNAPGLPSWRAWAAVYTDLNIGLLVNFPFLPLALGVLVLWLWRESGRLPRPTAAGGIALAAALALPVAFAQTGNLNHGGTPGMCRYALWLIPLAAPLLIAAAPSLRRPPRWLTATVALSCLWCLVFFHPGRAERYQQPTRLAAAMWRHAPRLSSPLPEVFAERLTHHEPGLLPIAIPSCAKVLLLGGRWPAPCAPGAGMPEACREPTALCYANRSGARASSYVFDPIREPLPIHDDNLAVWPRAIEERVAGLLDELGAADMVASADAPGGDPLRAAQGVGWTTALLGEDRFFLYAGTPREGGTVTLRLPQAMSGTLVAMSNGVVLRDISSPARPGELWNIVLPPVGEPGVALVLRADSVAAGS